MQRVFKRCIGTYACYYLLLPVYYLHAYSGYNETKLYRLRNDVVVVDIMNLRDLNSSILYILHIYVTYIVVTCSG